MRTPAFRGVSETDWGLPASRSSDLIREVSDATCDLFYYFVAHRRAAVRLRALASRQKGPLRLSIGSGRYVPDGWIGLDRRQGDGVIQCDLRRPIPLAESTVEAVLAEHVLEHFPLDDLPVMLADYRRVLRPGAPIRIVCPDARVIAQLILGEETDRVRAQDRLDRRLYRWTDPQTARLTSANRLSHQYGQHQSLLTAELVAHLLTAGGFTGVAEVSPDESRYFAEVPTTHFRRFPDSRSESFVVEAVRPINGDTQ